MRWADENNLKLLYSPQDKGTFHSARWQRDYTPDLVFVTVSNAGVSHASRRVLSNFPRSQHRPFLVTLGITVPYVQTLPKPRWNFNKADWKLFSSYIDKTCIRIPANIDNIKRFSKLILTSVKNTFQGASEETMYPVGLNNAQDYSKNTSVLNLLR